MYSSGLAFEEVDQGLMENIVVNNITMNHVHHYPIYITTIIQHDGWAIIGLYRGEAHIIYFDAIHVAGIETEGWSFLGKLWFWVVCTLFTIFLFRQFCLAATTILQPTSRKR